MKLKDLTKDQINDLCATEFPELEMKPRWKKSDMIKKLNKSIINKQLDEEEVIQKFLYPKQEEQIEEPSIEEKVEELIVKIKEPAKEEKEFIIGDDKQKYYLIKISHGERVYRSLTGKNISVMN